MSVSETLSPPAARAPLRTYSEVVSSSPVYPLEGAQLFYAILPPIASGIVLILAFFFLPWISVGAGNVINFILIPPNPSGFDIASSTVILYFPRDSLSFPLLWVLPVVGLAQIVLGMLPFRDRVLPVWTLLSIRVSFGLAFIIEIIYLFSSFGAFAFGKSALPSDASFGTSPSSGLWICVLITLTAGGIYLFLHRSLTLLRSANQAYSAALYAAGFPYTILTLAAAGVGLILAFSLLPWFSASVGNVSNPVLFPPSNPASSFDIATSGVTLFFPRDSFSFPLLWLLPLVGLAQIVLAALLLKDRVITTWMFLSIRVSFGLALLIEVIYLFVSLFLAFSYGKSSGFAISTGTSSGLWASLLITLIAGGICLFLIPALIWSWDLSTHHLERAARRAETRTNRPIGAPE